MSNSSLLLITIGFLSSTVLLAQSTLTIVVKSTSSDVVPSATVILEGISKTTDANGAVVFNRNEGQNNLYVFAEDFETSTQELPKDISTPWIVVLKKEAILLNQILIQSTTEGQQVHRNILKPLTVDTKAVITRPTSLTDVINRSTGVRIRESGGLGSQVNVNLNGFQGQAIRFFKDGIPLNYLGEGYSLANVPLEVLDGVEIYKGIVPIHLASDALGGAVNLLSATSPANGGRVSLAYGSFDTWRGALRWHHNINDSIFIGMESFYNYSKNNYKVRTPNEELAKTKQEVTLFHNAYEHFYANAYVGIQHQSWADVLRFDLSFYALDKDVQHSPASMTTPYGAVKHKQKSVIPSLRYKKTLLGDRLSIDQFISYNVVKTRAIDTLKGTYTWTGDFQSSSIRGEGEHPTAAAISLHHVTSRTLLGYRLNDQQQLWLNNSFHQVRRTGSDAYGKRLEDTGEDILDVSTKYSKHVLALGITSQWLKQRFETTAAVKSYHYRSQGLNTAHTVNLHSDRIFHSKDHTWGWAIGMKYQLTPLWALRASIENARRLPSVPELFGDNLFIASNFSLQPEQSLNVNLGINYTGQRVSYSLSGFYRDTKDIIVLASGNPPLSVYINKEKAKGYGFEGDLRVKIATRYSFFTNFTWQSIRYGSFSALSERWMKGTRVPNIPYFFANVGVEGLWDKLFQDNDALTVYANLNFVREFYIQTIDKSQEPGGFLGLFGKTKGDVKNIVPDQTLVNLGALYTLKTSGLSLGVEVRNVLNQDMYDYFKIQKAGRSFNLKLNYKF